MARDWTSPFKCVLRTRFQLRSYQPEEASGASDFLVGNPDMDHPWPPHELIDKALPTLNFGQPAA